MKKFNKIMLAGGVTLALGGAVATNLLTPRQQEQFSDLTLADIELFASPCQPESFYDPKEDITIITVCERTSTIWGSIMNIWCDAQAMGSCSVMFKPEK